MNYDPLLKSIFQSLFSRAVWRLGGSPVVEVLNIECPTAESRRPDLVVRLANGTILHVEIQSSNDPTMPWRMLQYRLLLRTRYPDARIVQKVLYVGKGRLSMPAGLEDEGLAYSYEVVDIRDFDTEELLTSPLPAERALALLCRTPDRRRTVRRMLKSWANSSRREWDDLAAILVVVSGLRGLQKLVREELSKMPLPIRELFLENDIVRELVDEGAAQSSERARCEQADVLRRMLERRFGPLTTSAAQRVSDADVHQIQDWMLRTLDASSVDEVLS